MVVGGRDVGLFQETSLEHIVVSTLKLFCHDLLCLLATAALCFLPEGQLLTTGKASSLSLSLYTSHRSKQRAR